MRGWRLFPVIVAGAAVLALFLKAMPPLLLIVVLVGALGYWSYRGQARAKAAAAGSAIASLGLRPVAGGGAIALALPLRLLSRGADRHVDEVLAGSWRGYEVQVFDLRYRPTESISGEQVKRFSCAVASVDAGFPPVVIEPRAFLSVPTELGGLAETGWEKLDRDFIVLCGDEAFVSALLDDAMRAWLSSLGDEWGFELAGRAVLCYTQAGSREAFELLDALAGFARCIRADLLRRYAQPAGLDASSAEP
jgi:hypothetical protein